MLRSFRIWLLSGSIILLWVPILAVRRLFDRDPVHYRTGALFRGLGRVLTRLNPSWKLSIGGEKVADPRHPYVFVSNHQSLADIPILCNFPWEMKWMAKKELFRTPVLGWLLRLAGDIAVDRGSARSGARALLKAQQYLRQKCSVMIFPEGTRTKDGRVQGFADGAFMLAIRAGVPILPVVIEGTFAAIKKASWRFGSPSTVTIRVLPPIETTSLSMSEVCLLRDKVRDAIINEIAQLRRVSPEEVDGLLTAG